MTDSQIMVSLMIVGFSVNFSLIKMRWNSFNQKFEKIDQRFDKMEEKLTDIDRRVYRIEGALALKYCCILKEDNEQKKAK